MSSSAAQIAEDQKRALIQQAQGLPETTTPENRKAGLNREHSPETRLTSEREGQMRVLDAMEGAYVYVAVYELAHHIQNINPDEYALLHGYVLDRLKANSRRWKRTANRCP